MKRALLAAAFVAAIFGSLDVKNGDLRFNTGGHTLRHWDWVSVGRPACAVGLTPSGGFPCGSGAGSTTYTLTGPGTGIIGNPTSNYAVQGAPAGPVAVTPNDATHGGIFTPASVTLTGSGVQTFTYTPLQAGAYNISTTNGGALTDPAPIGFTITNQLAGYPGYTARWTTNATTLATGGAGDPFGGSNRATMTEDGTAANHFIAQSWTAVANQTYTISAMVKRVTGARNAEIGFFENGFSSGILAVFDPAACSLVSTGPTGSGTISSTKALLLSSGWCLIEMTGSIGAFTGVNTTVAMDDGANSFYTGDGASSLQVYGSVIQ